jgi:hypothetical protein
LSKTLVDSINITYGEFRVWLLFNVSSYDEIRNGSSQRVWYMEFERCGEDPTADAWMAKCEAKAKAKNREIEKEQERLAQERALLPPPKYGSWISPGLIQPWDIYKPRTWLDYVVDNIGWCEVLRLGMDMAVWPLDDTGEEGPLDFLLRKGIAPGQPFLVRFFGHTSWGPDFGGDYDEEWSCEVIALGPPPPNVIEEIEQAWALKERLAISTATEMA